MTWWHIFRPFAAAYEYAARRDGARCSSCRRWSRSFVIHGLYPSADPDATSRLLCASCARRLLSNAPEGRPAGRPSDADDETLDPDPPEATR